MSRLTLTPDWRNAYSFACHSAACAPPPAGTGGSISSGGSVTVGGRVVGRYKGGAITMSTEGLRGVRVTGRNQEEALAKAIKLVKDGSGFVL